MTLQDIEWNRLFVHFSKPQWDGILRFCFSFTKEHGMAEDLLQTTLLKGLQAFPRFVRSHATLEVTCEEDVSVLFDNPATVYHFKNWIYKIAKNSFLDQQEQRDRWQYDDHTLDVLPSPQPTLSFAASSDPVQRQIQQDAFYHQALDDNWKEKINRLNEKQRGILFLAAEGYSYKEIAQMLDIPLGTVMSALARSIQKLRQEETQL